MDVKYNLPRSQGDTSLKDLGYEDFDPAEGYAAGDVVIYNNGLKKFTTAHEGAWDDDDATDTSVAEEAASEHAGRVAGDSLILKQLGDIPTWTERSEEQGGGSDRAYAEGKYLFHNWTDPTTQETTKRVYRVVNAIEIGDIWSEQNVLMTSVFNELDTLLVGEEEVVHLNITSDDALMEVDNLAVTISYEDGGLPQILHCDEVGDVTFSVPKGRFYTIAYVDVEGYNKPASDRLKASSAARYINRVYENVVPVTTSTITVHITVAGSASAQLNGKFATLVIDGTYRNATISNSQAVFSGLPMNKTAKVFLPRTITLTTPAAIELVTDQTAISATANYTKVQSGVLAVADDGTEAKYEDFDFDTKTCVAIHVSAKFLSDAGCDFYVDVNSLQNKVDAKFDTHPGYVSISYQSVEPDSEFNLDGEANTQAAIADATIAGYTTPAATYATSATLTIAGITVNGFIPTKNQFQIMVDNRAVINAIATRVAGSSSWYSWKLWTCSTNGEKNGMYYCSNGTFTFEKSSGNSLQVLPVFYK